jgi:hypothetical protein
MVGKTLKQFVERYAEQFTAQYAEQFQNNRMLYP